MRIALVWNAPQLLVDITFRYELYVVGLERLGLDVLTICPSGTEVGYPHSVLCFADERELTVSGFWEGLRCEAVVIVTWHRMTSILHAIRAARIPVLAIGESDAEVSPRRHPWATFRYMTFLQRSRTRKLGAAKHWLQRLCFSAGSEHRDIIENTAASDVFTLAGQGAVSTFRSLLLRLGAADLTARVAWIPYPVPDIFCDEAVEVERSDRIIAIGRWDSPQKNPGLLARTLELLGERGDRTEVLVVGRGAEGQFARAARRNKRIQLLGVQSRDRIRDLMAVSRAVLVPSRWESGPIVVNEMLALGGTVIGTPISNLRTLTADGRFGRVSRSHSAHALAAAIGDEMRSWVIGERDPTAIAAHWRRLVSQVAVAERMLELLNLNSNRPIVPSL